MKPKAVWVKCIGEAHTDSHIDHCLGCAPYWETYPICPVHETKLKQSGYCKTCKKYYKI